MGRGGEMGRGGMGMPMGRGGEMGRGGMGMRWAAAAMGGRGGMRMGMGTARSRELPEYAWDGLTKTLLFRFFDDTVEPGHRYRYRVRLVLKDVNVDQPAKFLDPTVRRRRQGEAEESLSLPHDRMERAEPRRRRAAARSDVHRPDEGRRPASSRKRALIIKSVDSDSCRRDRDRRLVSRAAAC